MAKYGKYAGRTYPQAGCESTRLGTRGSGVAMTEDYRLEAPAQPDNGGGPSDHQIYVHFFCPLGEPADVPDGYLVRVESAPERTSGVVFHSTNHGTELFDDGLLEWAPLLMRFWQETAGSRDPFDGPVQAAKRAGATDGPADPSGVPALPRSAVTVVELVAPVPDEHDQADLLRTLDGALVVLRDWQRAYQRVHPVPMSPVTRARLPGLVPIAFGHLCDGVYERPTDVGALDVESFDPVVWTSGIPMDDADLEQVVLALDHVSERPFASWLVLRYQATVARDRDGDLRVAVLHRATACEVLLDELLAHLLWEDHVAPEDAAPLFKPPRSTLDRVRTDLPQRLRGSWDVTKVDSLRAWRDDVAQLRNRVTHRAYEPSPAEDAAAAAATTGLVQLLGDRLAGDHRHPLTTLMLIGEDGLAGRGVALTGRRRKAVAVVGEGNAPAAFRRWWMLVLDLTGGGLPSADATRSHLMLLQTDAVTRVYFLHDRASRQVRLLSPVSDLLPAGHAATADFADGVVGTCDVDFPLVGAVNDHGLDPATLPTLGPWLREHHLSPLAGLWLEPWIATVDPDDFRAAADDPLQP